MSKEIQKWVELYKINFFQPKNKDDRNVAKESIIISKEAYFKVKEDLTNNKWIEIWDELYNPYTIDTVKKYKIEESIHNRLSKEPKQIQEKVKYYMKFEKKDTNLWRLELMIEKAREETNLL